MTPQERKLIDELFDRLQSLEESPRHEDAVDAINAGLDRAPNALYPLVQTVLVQDEALKRADARIRELEEKVGTATPQGAQQPGFLDNMRDSIGQREPQGSVPSVKPGADAKAKQNLWGPAYDQSQSAPPQGQPAYADQSWGGAPQPPQGQGGSFLGTAAAAAAGVVGGALLMNSFKGMFGGQQPGQARNAFDQPGGGAPWDQNPAGGGDLARQAGIDDLGKGGRTAAYDDGAASDRAGLFDVAANDSEEDDEYMDDDDGDDSEGEEDTA